MKKIILLAFILSVLKLQAQTTAKDWTQADCNGVSHHLFSELDSGNIILLEFVMMDCSPCVNAANSLKPVIEKFKTSNPGKVRFYSMGSREFYDCDDMNAWKNDNNFNHTVFAGIKGEVDYYGGMGMPTIVVLGNNNHSIFYKKIGYSPSENVKIEQAINTAITVTGVKENKHFSAEINLYPNPAANNLHVSFNNIKADKIQITDISGRQIQIISCSGNDAIMNTEKLEAGIYKLNLLSNGRIIGTKSFVKNASN
ncbi:MAG: T9SS type A sorting domain-containing protein [Sphingobacteriales bacterium]|nr:MAG: T9SS type A sorting domain-containing protein [Sphingobacteriales bacterium]